MICANRDQDILLLAHGELSVVRRLLVQIHLHGCPRCRERAMEFSAVSRRIAAAIRPADGPGWSMRTSPSAAAATMRIARAKLAAAWLAVLVAFCVAGSVVGNVILDESPYHSFFPPHCTDTTSASARK
ncbi:MAG: anti-sigma factor family protein [Capsulimonadaceae bacterium]